MGNVLFSGFAKRSGKAVSTSVQGEPKPISAEDAYYVLEAAGSVVIVPGYGMAVAQASTPSENWVKSSKITVLRFVMPSIPLPAACPVT